MELYSLHPTAVLLTAIPIFHPRDKDIAAVKVDKCMMKSMTTAKKPLIAPLSFQVQFRMKAHQTHEATGFKGEDPTTRQCHRNPNRLDGSLIPQVICCLVGMKITM